MASQCITDEVIEAVPRTVCSTIKLLILLHAFPELDALSCTRLADRKGGEKMLSVSTDQIASTGIFFEQKEAQPE